MFCKLEDWKVEAIKIFCKLEDKKGKAIIIFGKLEDKNVEAIAIFCKKRREKSGDHHDLLQLKGYNFFVVFQIFSLVVEPNSKSFLPAAWCLL